MLDTTQPSLRVIDTDRVDAEAGPFGWFQEGTPRRLHAEALAVLLCPDSRGPARYAEDRKTGWFTVLAVGLLDTGPGARDLVRNVCWDSLSSHLVALRRSAVTGILDDTLYAVVRWQCDNEPSTQVVREFAASFCARLPSRTATRLVVGIGSAVGADGISRSRSEADEAVRLQRVRQSPGIADLGQLRFQSLMLRLAEEMTLEQSWSGAVIRGLRQSDDPNRLWYLDTLRAYLHAGGDIAQAATTLGLHHNTVRYRLRRLEEDLDIDFSDADHVFRLTLELRLVELASREPLRALPDGYAPQMR